jgi:DNA-binding NarL/FixJ family response regulator
MEAAGRAGRGRILIADDHALIRLSLRDELEAAGFGVCAEAATGAEALEAALRSQPELCLLDVNMPEGGGIAAAAAIRRELPQTKVMLITAEPSATGALAAARAGADGYLDKAISPDRLPDVVAAVLAGESAYPRRLLPGLLAELRAA